MRVTIFLILISCPYLSRAQFVEQRKFQLLLSGGRHNYGIVPLQKDGVAIFKEADESSNMSFRKWDIIHYDTALSLVRKITFESEIRYLLSTKKYYDGALYLMFQDSNVPMRSIFFVKVYLATGKVDSFEISSFLPPRIIDFEVLGHALFLIGDDFGKPSVLKFRFGEDRLIALKGFYDKKVEIVNYLVLKDRGLFQVITRSKRQSGNFSLRIMQFDETGILKKDLEINSGKGYHLTNALATTRSDGVILVAGTYTVTNLKKSSSGIFTAAISPGQKPMLYYYNYRDLHHFFDYLPEKKRWKMQNKFSKEGGKQAALRETAFLRKLSFEYGSGLFLCEYAKLTEQNSQVYGRLWPMDFKQFSHALALGISTEGKLLWDQCFNLDNSITNSDLSRTAVGVMGERVVLCALEDSYIKYRVLFRGKDMEDNRKYFLEPGGLAGQTAEESEGELVPWYDQYFLMYEAHSAPSKTGVDKQFFNIKKLSFKVEKNTP